MTRNRPPAGRRSTRARTVKPARAKSKPDPALDQYSAKRAFDVTPEPRAVPAVGRVGPLLFVVQQHSARRLHYDFRLEVDGVLKSWAVPKGPSLNPTDKRLAVQTEDHPFDYGSFEGVIPPKQYGAGEVIVWDCGVYSPDDHQEYFFHDRAEAERRVRTALDQGKLSLFLRGEKVKGSFALVRSSDKKNWFLIKHKDRFAHDADRAALDRSVLSGLTVDELKIRPAAARIDASRLAPAGKPEALPARLAPMLADSADVLPAEGGWSFEPKLDGYRVLACMDGTNARLQSRRGLDLTAVFPRITAELASQSVAGMILDGEIVVLGPDGKPSFNALQNRVQLKTEREIEAADRNAPALLYAFDILHFAGIDLRGAAYSDRRRYLAQCLLPSSHLQLIHVARDGEALYRAALANGFEGVVAKRDDSKYEPGRRSPAWRKIKPTQSGEFVIGGYTQGKGARAPLGALLVGYWEGGRLKFASNVGTGFDEAMLRQLKRELDPLKRATSAFVETPPGNAGTTWVKPERVAEIRFAEWTDDEHLRMPVFLRLRDDIDPRTVRRPEPRSSFTWTNNAPSAEAQIDDVVQQLDNKKSGLTLAVGEHRIRLTNLDRVYWPADRALKAPALTKRDFLRYLARVSPYMLPHLADRPLTMIRMPEGIDGPRFFQKHWDQPLPPFVESLTIFSESKDERQDYLLCNNLATLLWVAQAGTLEFHVWHSRAKPGPDAVTQSTDFASSVAALEGSILNYPDYLVFDIDPYIYSGKEAPGAEPELNKVAFDKGKEVAFWLRDLLLGMRLEAIVKTSGKTGLHLFVPIARRLNFDEARQVCEMVGRHLVQQHPRVITMEWSVNKRTGKIFIDYNMNVRGKTLNVAYSPRGVPGAPVSMPLAWNELAEAHPLDFRITNAVERLARTGDQWQDALIRKQDLKQALGRKDSSGS